MKKQSNNLFATISIMQMENLTNVVNENLAPGVNQSQSKVFTAADLWNIQRMGKSRTQRKIFI